MNTNAWNRWRYTLYTPIYDWVVRALDANRQRAIMLLALQPQEKVLLLGAGTGEDLRYLPAASHVTAIDITPSMVEKIRQKAHALNREITAMVMDGQNLNFPDAQFDAVVLNLIIAVIPDPNACMREAARVLKPEGRIVIFDKFLDENQKPSVRRRLFNAVIQIVATSVNRQLRPIADQAGLLISCEEPAPRFARLGFKITLLRKCK